MIILSFIGWAIVGAAVAYAVAMKNKELATRWALDDGHPKRDNIPCDPGAWCNVLEEIARSTVYVFDDALRLVSAGNHARKKNGVGSHIIDIVPEDILTPVLQHIKAARDGKNVDVKVDWAGELVCVRISLVGNSGLVVMAVER